MNKKYFWYVADLALFMGLNILLLWKLLPKFGLLQIGWLQVVIFGLAVYRAANIISNEKVMKPLREPFVNEKQEAGKTVEVPKARGFAGAMGNLIYCPSCTGTWIAMILVYSWLVWPKPVEVIALILALSGAERIYASFLGYLKK